MKIIPLSEGSFTVDRTKQFVPFDLEKDKLVNRPAGSLLVEIQPFCIIMKDDVVVIDTGLGFSNTDGAMQIHQNLADAGISPLDVTKVLISHLHKDHSGGISREDKFLKQKNFSFPNATYYVNKDEFDFAIAKGKPSYTPDEFSILADSDKVIFTTGNGYINGAISYEVTGAHCPYHQVFWIKEGDETIFFGGDVAPQLVQMKNRFTAKYDFDGKKCMELRQKWWQQGQLENWTFLFYHDIKTPIFSFTKTM